MQKAGLMREDTNRVRPAGRSQRVRTGAVVRSSRRPARSPHRAHEQPSGQQQESAGGQHPHEAARGVDALAFGVVEAAELVEVAAQVAVVPAPEEKGRGAQGAGQCETGKRGGEISGHCCLINVG